MKKLRRERLEHLANWLDSLEQLPGFYIHWHAPGSSIVFTFTNTIWKGNSNTFLGVTGAICQMFQPFRLRDCVKDGSYWNRIPSSEPTHRAKRLLGMDQCAWNVFLSYLCSSRSPADYAKGIREYLEKVP